MFDIEGESRIVAACPDLFEPAVPSTPGASSDSWTMETTSATSSDISPKRVLDFEEEDWWIGVGDVGEVPNTWAGGSNPGASILGFAA